MAEGRRLETGSGAVPVGYRHMRHPAGRCTVWAPAAAWAATALEAGTLYDWAAGRPERSEFSGRGPVYTVPAPLPGPDECGRWAVRHYWRGGAMAMPLGDRYVRFGRARPFREIVASTTARARGIRTPAVVAGATYSVGPYYRCDLITEVVPDVEPLADVLHAHDGTRGWLDAMATAGALIRQLAEAGVFHVDLNAWNVLLHREGTRAAWVVDLDRARILRKPSHSIADRMTSRLARSIAKVGTPTGELLGHAEIEAALDARTAGP